MEHDLSFSGIVSYIQHDDKIAKKMLIDVCTDYMKVKEEIKKLEDKLIQLEGVKSHYRQGVDRILKHMEKELPLAINLDNALIVISESGITLEKNVI